MTGAWRDRLLACRYEALADTRGNLCPACTTTELYHALETAIRADTSLPDALYKGAQGLARDTSEPAREIEEALRRGLAEALVRTHWVRGEEKAYLAADALARGCPDADIEERFQVAVERAAEHSGRIEGHGFVFTARHDGALIEESQPSGELMNKARAAARKALALD